MNRSLDFVRYALKIRALELVPERRKLKSGRLSPYFFNSGLFKTGQSLYQLANAYAEAIDKHSHPDVIFGPAYKGIPLAVAIALAFQDDIEYAFNRKEAKDHGEEGIIVGAPLKGKKVCLVDDVMTTGESLAEGIDIVVKAEGIPTVCAIAFDRQERGKEGNLSAVQEFQKRYQIPVIASATFEDLLVVAEFDDMPILPKLLEYKKEWGV